MPESTSVGGIQAAGRKSSSELDRPTPAAGFGDGEISRTSAFHVTCGLAARVGVVGRNAEAKGLVAALGGVGGAASPTSVTSESSAGRTSELVEGPPFGGTGMNGPLDGGQSLLGQSLSGCGPSHIRQTCVCGQGFV